MILNELERVTVAYLANALVSGIEPDIVEDDNPILVTLGSQTLRLYKGESNVDQVLPAIVVNCETGTEDFNTGNFHCLVEVTARVAADPSSENPKPVSLLADIGHEITRYMSVDDLPQKLNVYGGESFTAIGLLERGHIKSATDHTLVQGMTVNLYCAENNLNAAI